MVDENFPKTKKTDLPEISKRILVVVPNPDTRQEICNFLTSAGYIVHPVKNADEGLTFLSIAVPDLIISDVDMPGLTGIEFCIKVRENIQTAAVPLILLADTQQV